MKQRIMSMFLLACLLIVGCAGNKTSKRLDEAFEGYLQYIKEVDESWEGYTPSNIKYTLTYINEDDIPDLVISTGDAHVSTVRICFYDFENKKVVDTGENYCQNGDLESFYFKKSCIYNYYFGNGGYMHVSFCRIGDAPDYKVTKSRNFTVWLDEEWNNCYSVDNVKVSKEEYDRAYAEDAAELADEERVTIRRDDMPGDHLTYSEKDAMDLFYKMIE